MSRIAISRGPMARWLVSGLAGLSLAVAVSAAEPRPAVTTPAAEVVMVLIGPTGLAAPRTASEVDPPSLEDAEAAWLWSPKTPPRRYSGAALREAWPDLEALGFAAPAEALTVFLPADGHRPPARVVSAPAAMWREVPEGWLPRHSVPRQGALMLPRDREVPWRVRYLGEGTGLGGWAREVAPGAAQVELTPRPATDFSARVVSPDGVAVPDATLTLLDAVEGTARPEVISVYRSDARGLLRLASLLADRSASFGVGATGYGPRFYRGRLRDLPSTLVLAPAATLSGRFTDGDGQPVAGVRVAAEGWVSEELPISFRRKAKSHTDGTWALPDLPLRNMILTARREGFAPLRQSVELEEPGHQNLGELMLSRGAGLVVRVVNQDRLGLPGAAVTVDGLPLPAVVTDENGLAGLVGLPAGRPLDLTVTKAGYLDGEVEVKPPWPDEVLAEVVEGFTVSGRFVDATGLAVIAGQVKVRTGNRFRYEELGADGAFQELLEPGAVYTLEFAAPESRRRAVEVTPGLPGEHRDLGEVVAPPGLVVYGSLVSSVDGAPVAGGRLWAPRSSSEGELMSWLFDDLVETRSGEDGSFELGGLDPAPSRVRVEAPGFARAELDVAPEEGALVVDAGTVELVPGATLIARVEGADEEDDSGLQAKLDLNGEWDPMDMLTAPVVDGVAEFLNVPAGTGVLLVEAGRGDLLCEKEARVSPEDEVVEVVCDARRSPVAGWVLVGDLPAGAGLLTWAKGDGETVREAAIMTRVTPGGLRQQQVFGGGRPEALVDVADDGSFESDRLTPGAWTVTWQPASGSVAGPRKVRIPEGEVRGLTVVFPGQGISGVVVDGEGLAVSRATVRELGTGTFALTRPDGSFSMTGLEPGSLRLQARERDRYSEIVDVLLENDRTPDPLRLTVSEEHRGRIPVRAWTAAGAPAARAFVFVEGEGSARMQLVTAGSEGTAEVTIPAPYPARVRLAVYHEGNWALGPWINWAESRKGIEIELAAGGELVVYSEGGAGRVDLATGDGWDLDRLLGRLGVLPRVSPERPLVLSGLPEGRYTASFQRGGPSGGVGVAATSSISVREGRRESLILHPGGGSDR